MQLPHSKSKSCLWAYLWRVRKGRRGGDRLKVCRWRRNGCCAAINTRAHLQRGEKEITALARTRLPNTWRSRWKRGRKDKVTGNQKELERCDTCETVVHAAFRRLERKISTFRYIWDSFTEAGDKGKSVGRGGHLRCTGKQRFGDGGLGRGRRRATGQRSRGRSRSHVGHSWSWNHVGGHS